MTSEGRTVLLVDRNTVVRRALAISLVNRGYSVLEATGAEAALEQLWGKSAHLVLMDVSSHLDDACELAHRLRESGSDAILLAMAGQVSSFSEVRLTESGFDDVLSKPVDAQWLHTLIDARYSMSHVPAPELGRGFRVVLADDDVVQRKLVQFTLTRLGFQVWCAGDGEEALDVVRKEEPDVLIADVLMPKIDGFELASVVRLDSSLTNIPVLLLTSSYVEDADRALALRCGAVDLVVRTPGLEGLVEVLSRVLVRRSLLPPPVENEREVEALRVERVRHQLDRQVRLNRRLARRCSALESEVAVLTSASEAMLTNRDLEEAMCDSLRGCLEVGNIRSAALFTHSEDGEIRIRAIDATSEAQNVVRALANHRELVTQQCKNRVALCVPSSEIEGSVADQILTDCGAEAMLIVPLSYLDQPLGALALVATKAQLEQDDWQTFVRAVVSQTSLALAMSVAFRNQKRAEVIAKERTAFLDALLVQAPDDVLSVGEDGAIRYANHGGKSHTLASHDAPFELQEELKERLRSVLSTGEAFSWEGVTQAGGDRRYHWYKMGPIRRDGRIDGAVVVVRDITSKKEIDAQLMAADRLASVGVLAAGVAHEINNPLTSAMLNVQMALESVRAMDRLNLPPSLDEQLQDAANATERIRTIVKDLKLFSRDGEEQLIAVDIEHVIDATLRMVWPQVRNCARVLKDYNNVPRVAGNEARLGQVIMNLLINAAQAIPPGDPRANFIKVATRVSAAGQVVITVSDSGPGIPPQVGQKLFTPFFTTKPVGKGTGLGLSISKRIIESFEGTLEFESELGVGTKFTIQLPVATTQPLRRTSEPVSSGIRPLARVLVVDDEEAICAAIQRALEARFHVSAAVDARVALQRIRDGERFDVILCDLIMPLMNGQEFLETLTQLDSKQAGKIAFITGGAHAPWAEDFLNSRLETVLEKPFTVRSLQSLVRKLVS